MSDNYGTGVSRVLDPKQASILGVIWQQGKPPLDSELNLAQQLQANWSQQLCLRGTPSGFLGNDANTSKDYLTNPSWSNWFQFGRQRSGEKQAIAWAVVNGWLIPVTGTRTGTPPGSPNNTDTWNKIALDPPPANSGDFRADFTFLEVWVARVPPGPSTLNKPSASAVYRYGNVEGGYSYLPDDIQDPQIGVETTQRVQVQYRIRVVKGLIGLATYPDGFDPTLVKGRGAATADTAFTFTNMRQELGDPGLWRAGDGTANSLGTVDGYVYAIPLCAVFRRNSVVWSGDPSQNLNGGFNRNPVATDRTGVQTFSTVATLAAGITDVATSLTIVSATNIPLPTSPASPVLIQIGDELLTYTSISGTTLSGLTRGVNGTQKEAHLIGRTIKVVSSRPDGLFSDQIAATDILDLRHVVSPNGFDYSALLAGSLDKLLKGQLRSNWKRTGGGPQGTFITYQDKVSASAAGMGITKVDSPDGIRMIFSDAAAMQKVEVLCTPFTAAVAIPATQPIGTSWSLAINALTTRQRSGNQWDTELSAGDGLGDRINILVAQFKNTVPGADADQVRLLNESPAASSAGQSAGGATFTDATSDLSKVQPGDTLVIYQGTNRGSFPVLSSVAQVVTVDGVLVAGSGITYEIRRGVGSIQVRIDGMEEPLPQHRFKVTPLNPTSSDDLTIEFIGVGVPFPIAKTVYVTSHVQYGAGRGLSHRPDSIHNLAMYNPAADILVPSIGVPSTNYTLGTTWALLWSKYRSAAYKNLLPVTAGSYADLGSKTVILTPFRRIAYPATPTGVRTQDGESTNRYTATVTTGTAGSSVGTTTFTDAGAGFGVSGVVANDSFEVTKGLAAGKYRVVTVSPTTLVLDRPIPTASNIAYSVYHTQGLMPFKKRDGLTAKWTTTDPLGLFSGSSDPDANRKNFFVSLPRHLVPGWGEVHAPILSTNGALFHRGVNYMLQAREGLNTNTTDADHCKQFINYTSNVPLSYASMSTGNFSGPTTVPATYNSTFSYGGVTQAGARLFTDQRGLGRQGIELPPFYGIARLFGVYESSDYKTNGSAFNPSTRELTGGGAKNLLRANFTGPTFWVEIDDDGDSTFVVNANALDLDKSPVAIPSFASKHYVVEASVFGFDRDSFDLTKPFRLVLSRDRTAANTGVRATNTDAIVVGPVCVLPGPLTTSDTVLVNYSRTPYQGDPWGSQLNYLDVGYSPGPLQTSTAYQLVSSQLDESALTRPNQTSLEVLASKGFITSLGSGRLSGDVVAGNAYDFRNVGFEEPTTYPPVSGVTPRPRVNMGAIHPLVASDVNPEYLGASERLPMGALWRDKDFRGDAFTKTNQAPLVYTASTGVGVGGASLARTKTLDQEEIALVTATQSSGQTGDVLVHVDGEVGNYAALTNFRTYRGGSAFMGSGERPGGEIFTSFDALTDFSQVLVGQAFLVRNTVTTVGANEVSAGDELLMAIVTTRIRNAQAAGVSTSSTSVVGTNGTAEGYSAVALYRIDGHPLLSDNVKYEVDPTTVLLPKKFSFGG